MAMQYLNQIKNRRRSSQILKAPNPVLTEEEEAYLRQVTSQADDSQLKSEVAPGDKDESQIVAGLPATSEKPLSVGEAQAIPLPASPGEELGKQLGEAGRKASMKSEDTEKVIETTKSPAEVAPAKKKRWSTMFWKKNGDTKKDKDTSTADKAPVEPPAPAAKAITPRSEEQEAQKEQEDMTDILERLNLAADNNRVFSVSDETQELLRKFKLIFKDLINGVPTAYRDLEMLLTNGNRQLQDTYTKLPGFMQKLIEKLPEKWTESLAPEMLAVAGERAAQNGINMEHVGKAAAAAEKMGIPSLKELVSKPAAIVGMLRSIMTFLRARFPAAMGMNVLWSLALFILLFVLWYCHKRGREVRLENERLVTEEEIRKLNENASETQIRPTETLTTIAPQGAPADEVREGVRTVERSRATSALEAASSEPPAPEPSSPNDENERPTPAPAAAPLPTRSKSRLSMWGRPKPEPTPSNISPYPGT